jgi:Protein of unknown function (DUF1552)
MNPAFSVSGARLLSRRRFLRGAGVALSLPFLDAMTPAFATAAGKAAAEPARRMVLIETDLGILPEFFFPEQPGANYPLTPYLELLKAHRNDLTVFSGVSHPDVDGGHAAEVSFLTAAPHPGGGSFKNTISLDQFAAERMGALTRFPSFVLHVGTPSTLSFTRSGVAIPAEYRPTALYRRMFVQGTAAETDARIEDLRVGRSVLDFVTDDARRLRRDLGPRDRERLDQYFASIRDLEGQLLRSESWERRPKPRTKAPPPTDITDEKRLIDRARQLFDMVRLALESDSTRLVTLKIGTSGVLQIPGVSRETHSLTHHGGVAESIAELRKIEEAQFRVLGELLSGLRAAKEEGATLLDRTMVLYGACLGSANAHSNTNLPVLLAGGGFRHGRHLAFDRQKNYPLSNLFVSMLQRLGIAADKFAFSTGTMRGLEMA